MTDLTLWTAVAAHNAAGDTGTKQDDLLAVNAAIATAVTSNTFTCTVSTSGWTSSDLSYVLEVLLNAGYTRSVSASTLTISW